MTFGCWNKTKISRISSGGIEGIHSIQEERLNVDYAECRLQSRKLATGRVGDSDVKRFRETCFTWYMSIQRDMLYVVHVGGKPSHARWDDVRRLGSYPTGFWKLPTAR